MEENGYTIKIGHGQAVNPVYRFNNPIDLTVQKGQQVAIVGPNASGKSLLTNTMLGQYPLLDNNRVRYGSGISAADIRLITFRDSYGSADSTYFYQQRWNMTEMGESPAVGDAFQNISADHTLINRLTTMFGLDSIWDKQLVTLSSGEMRKYQLARSLVVMPRILIIDSPFIGLDAPTRTMLCSLLETLISEWKLQIILVVSRDEDIPAFITHVIQVKDRCCLPSVTAAGYFQSRIYEQPQNILSHNQTEWLKGLGGNLHIPDEIVKCTNVSLRYGSRCILDRVNWTIRKGEKWILLGPNGSGKSALLSLVYADNPQSYSQDIALFGRPRGSGESIWEIKRHIGYVSPEMHRSYTRHYPAIDIVASGLHDSIGLYRKITQEERESCLGWMDLFGVLDLENCDFYNLSSGQQRLLLLARAFVKNPSLLILDEPLHGLDGHNRRLALEIINAFSSLEGKTVIIVSHYPEELKIASLKEFTLTKH